jgi:hypothetical protein
MVAVLATVVGVVTTVVMIGMVAVLTYGGLHGRRGVRRGHHGGRRGGRP